MKETERMQFLIELPGSKVKEMHGSRLVAVTDGEVAFAFHDDPMDIINDVDNVLRVVCNEFVDTSKGETKLSAYLAVCLTLLDMAIDDIRKTKDDEIISDAREMISDFLSMDDNKAMF